MENILFNFDLIGYVLFTLGSVIYVAFCRNESYGGEKVGQHFDLNYTNKFLQELIVFFFYLLHGRFVEFGWSQVQGK